MSTEQPTERGTEIGGWAILPGDTVRWEPRTSGQREEFGDPFTFMVGDVKDVPPKGRFVLVHRPQRTPRDF